MSTDDRRVAVTAILERSRDLGFLGPGPVADHVAHAERYGMAVDRYRRQRRTGVGGASGGLASASSSSSALSSAADGERPAGPAEVAEVSEVADVSSVGIRVADLGAGGGVPSLPLLATDDGVDVTLVDASQKRMSFCAWALVELGVTDRARVEVGRAEDIGHRPQHRGRFDVVLARGFGPPATTVECAAPLLVEGGWCVISEPPGGRPWPSAIPDLGLELVTLDSADLVGAGVVVLARTGPCGDVHPRPIAQQKRYPVCKL